VATLLPALLAGDWGPVSRVPCAAAGAWPGLAWLRVLARAVAWLGGHKIGGSPKTPTELPWVQGPPADWILQLTPVAQMQATALTHSPPGVHPGDRQPRGGSGGPGSPGSGGHYSTRGGTHTTTQGKCTQQSCTLHI
jgi:hypothetical protein